MSASHRANIDRPIIEQPHITYIGHYSQIKKLIEYYTTHISQNKPQIKKFSILNSQSSIISKKMIIFVLYEGFH